MGVISGLRQWSRLLFLLVVATGLFAVLAVGKVRVMLNESLQRTELPTPVQGHAPADTRIGDTMPGRARMWHFGVVAVTSAGLAAAILFRYAVDRSFVEPVDSFADRLHRLTGGEGGLRMPVQKDGHLEVLREAVNAFIDAAEDANGQVRAISAAYKRHALALLELYDRPALLVDGSGGVALVNERGRKYIDGETGADFAAALKRAVEVSLPKDGSLTVCKNHFEVVLCDKVRGFRGVLLLGTDRPQKASTADKA